MPTETGSSLAGPAWTRRISPWRRCLKGGRPSLTGPSIRWPTASRRRFRLVTKDGLQVEVELVAILGEDEEASTDDEYWIRLEAGTYTTAVESGVEEAEDAAGQAEEINRRVAGWAYRIPKYKFDSMTKKAEDLLKPLGPGT